MQKAHKETHLKKKNTSLFVRFEGDAVNVAHLEIPP